MMAVIKPLTCFFKLCTFNHLCNLKQRRLSKIIHFGQFSNYSSSGSFRKLSGRVAGSITHSFAVSLQFRKLPEAFRKGCRKVTGCHFFMWVPEASGRIPEALPEEKLACHISTRST